MIVQPPVRADEEPAVESTSEPVKMSRRLFVTGTAAAAVGGAAIGRAAADPQAGHTLWYGKPATNWESESLPIGNGALGASVFGGVASELLQFNEKTLWTGGPGSPGYDFGNWRTPRPGAIETVQRRIDVDGRAEPDWVAGQLGQPRNGYGAYQSFGDLVLTQAAGPGAVSGYRRHLDIADAVAGVSYTSGGVHYTREYFATAPDNVIVARLSADKPGRISFTTAVRTQSNRTATITSRSGRITLSGRLNDNGLRFESCLLYTSL
ncbi:glycoside hydrolase N-terminal domain-containing protein, partial [Lentzea aerocolonigenes]|uniref:glycoside hydrolase family 95 protein n=1 Tax=Lentzea aerocolonigenes TaxID=68170 RepID=UPI001E568C14